ncbi:MAG: hypothetical protein A2622_00205 [Bdellovibrionales bacterium RIFCSPHIGHO2_01_FULL_40_29]|nr:MAG: hypothetical protein A2622_00205 [Bdellovibrionales bacterium RIFCSPHIGHO2_01_FULL_40_29]OFZ32548.1 MAG: hypothetical protein A3D17_04805 [Bdellovibrionales bacterium RIFCSPHIGHO2_02_FULL_40_15]
MISVETISRNSLALIVMAFFLLSACSPKISLVETLPSTKDSGSLETPPADVPPVAPPIGTEPSNPVVPVYSKVLVEMAGQSACLKNIWTDRGRAPAGYIKGMVLSYGRSLCRIKSEKSWAAARILAAANSGNAAKDVLAHYQDTLLALGFRIGDRGSEPLHATYTIGMGLGMRESSGRYCEGYDVAAGTNRTSAEAEAGLFQASYNSVSASPELKLLYDEYRAQPSRCHLTVFKEGVTCKSTPILGSGAGAEYQVFAKSCPAFAAEYTMTLIRILRAHFGPLNRKTAEVESACANLLTEAQLLIEQNPVAACAELL